jgi:hypothetical protein
MKIGIGMTIRTDSATLGIKPLYNFKLLHNPENNPGGIPDTNGQSLSIYLSAMGNWSSVSNSSSGTSAGEL